jgi:hypothetical protein
VHHPDKDGRCFWKVRPENEQSEASNKGTCERHSGSRIHYTFLGGYVLKRHRECELAAQSYQIVHPVKRFDENKDVYDLTRVFIDEFLRHPFAVHDDLIDAVSRIYDIDPQVPQIFEAQSTEGLAQDDDDEPYIPSQW